MQILKLNLSGRTAFFRQNDFCDFNTSYTYGHIHKLALLGMLGAILGLNGHLYSSITKSKEVHPEFYNRLKDLKVAIVPNANKGAFVRNKQSFINTCGYSKEGSGVNRNLIYIEQWIHNVDWDIYIDLDSICTELAEQLKDFIINNKCIYTPYLGKTNHPAHIKDAEVLEGSINKASDMIVDSFIKVNKDFVKPSAKSLGMDDIFEYRENLPFAYGDFDCSYVKCRFQLTNELLEINTDTMDIIAVDNRNIYMF